MRVTIFDYGAGNLHSLAKAIEGGGVEVRIEEDPTLAIDTDALVLPGVGAFGAAAGRLAPGRTAMREAIARGLPTLGICLGMQLLFEGSDEDAAVTLGTLPGRTVRLMDAPTLPHIGWNQVERTGAHPLFDGIDDGADFYFVHSYAGAPPRGGHATTDGDPLVLARTTHGRPFVSAVARGAMAGVQFHPERSGADGLRLLANFVHIVRAA